MARIRVLIVDDSVVIRKIVTEALSTDPLIEVVGTASNGRIALSKIQQVNPDIVTMDLEMPDMNGFDTIRQLRRTHPTLPVIVFSTLSTRGATATLDVLALGASDYVTKPSNLGSVMAAQQRVREDLIPRIRSLCWRVTGLSSALTTRPASTNNGSAAAANATRDGAATIVRALPQRIDVVAIGVSTGGPNALGKILPLLPASLPVPIAIVQHMPTLFTKMLADRLGATSALKIQEGTSDLLVQPGNVYIAKGDTHMEFRRSAGVIRVATNQAPPENSCRPAVDVLFKSIAETYGPNVLGIVLTGMGKDGLRGAQNIVDAGGTVIAQDEDSSVVWGMPGFVVNAGLADKVLPLSQIAPEILRRVSIGRRSATSATSSSMNTSTSSSTNTAQHFTDKYRHAT